MQSEVAQLAGFPCLSSNNNTQVLQLFPTALRGCLSQMEKPKAALGIEESLLAAKILSVRFLGNLARGRAKLFKADMTTLWIN